MLTAHSAHAEPVLRVRAQVSIELHTSNTASGQRLVGSLRDDLGAPLANRELTAFVDVQGQHGGMRGRTTRTDDTGRFSIPIVCSADSVCRATVEFDGDMYHERAAASQLVEPQRAELQLEFLEPRELEVSLDAPYTPVSLRAVSALGGTHVHVVLENELARVVGTGTTDADSKLHMQVDSSLLGDPGLGELVLRAAGDATRTAARSSKPVLRTRATQTELAAHYDPAKRELQVTVRLRTRVGPMAQRAVGVFAGELHLATLMTDAQGAGSRTLGARDLELEDGLHSLQARFESDVPGLTSSRSPAVSVRIQPPPRPSSAWLIAPALASLAFVLWSARRTQRKQAEAAPAARRTPEVRLGTPERGRTAAHFSLSGKVEDVDSGSPLAATVHLSEAASDVVVAVPARADGEFVSGQLPAGHYRARVLSPGYETATFEVAIPHPGTGSGLRVTLRSLRVAALDTYASVAEKALPAPRLCSATVRETLAAAISGGRAGPSFMPLAQSAERIAYGRAIPYEDDLLELQRRAAVALDEIVQRSPAPQDPDLGR